MWKTSVRLLSGFAVAVLAILSVIVAPVQTTQAAGTFQNPLNPNHGSDPWMLYYNGFYYLATTTWSSTSSRGLTMKKAASIQSLVTTTPITVWSDTTPSRCCNFWAPEFHLLSGSNGTRWYMYYVAGTSACCSNQFINVLESAGTDPMGPYTWKARLFDPANDNWAVDPTILQLNGNLYLIWSGYAGALFNSSQNLYIAPMSNPWTLSGGRSLLSVPTNAWETHTAPVNEGPEILQNGVGQKAGSTYLIFSASWCGTPFYSLGMSTYNGGPVTSQSSWVKNNSGPLFQQSAANGVYGPAHNGFFKSPDGTQDWLVYHAISNSAGDCTVARNTRIQQFTWNADGTPNFGVPLALSAVLNLPSGDPGAGGPTPTPTVFQPPTNTPSGPTATPIPGRIVWYKFDGNTNDSGGNGKNATLVNSPTFVTGKNGQAVNIAGGTQYVSMPAGIVNGLTNFSIATWVKLTSIANWMRIFDFGTGTTVNMFLTPTSGTTLRFAITTGGNGAEQRINGTSALSIGVWHHVAVTKNGNTGTLYVDGVQVGQNTSMTLSPSSLGNTTQNYIGKSQYTSDPNLNGAIDQFSIYNRALSAAEVQALFQNP